MRHRQNCGPSTILSLNLLYKRRREKEQEGGKGRRNSSCGKDKKKTQKTRPSGPDGTRPTILALEKQQHDNQEFTAILRDMAS